MFVWVNRGLERGTERGGVGGGGESEDRDE